MCEPLRVRGKLKMKTSWRTEIVHVLILIGLVALSVWGLAVAPDRIAIHWNIDGEVDGWGSKWPALLIIPVVAVGIYFLLRFLPLIDPHKKNYAGFHRAYQVIRVAVALMMVGIQVIIVLAAVGFDVDPGMWIMVAIGALFVLFGTVMADIKPNWFVGIRTPWTLCSDLSWSRTHQLAQWVFIGSGLMFAASGFIQAQWAIFIATGIMLTGILGVVVYSYFVWKDDPDRSPIKKHGHDHEST